MGCRCSSPNLDKNTEIKPEILSVNRIDTDILKQQEEHMKKYSDYPEKMLTLINKIRQNPNEYADIIEDSIKNIIKEEYDENHDGPRLIYKDKIKVALMRGEPAFREAADALRIASSLPPLIFKEEICIPLPDNIEDFKDSNYLRNKAKELLSQNEKSGLAQAYINGFKWAIQKGFDVFTSMDADFSHNPKYLAEAIKAIEEGYDMACGSRYIKNAHTDEKQWFRNLISIGGNIYINYVLGRQLKDWTGGFNTYTKEALKIIDLDSINVKGYIFQAQMKLKAVRKNCKIKEFPFDFVTRVKGKSKMNASIIVEALISVLKIRFGK